MTGLVAAGVTPPPRSDPGYFRAWYAQNRATELARLKAHRDSRRRFVDAVKLTAGCIDCGYREHPAALDFDHVGDDKTDHVGRLRSRASWIRLVAEIDKCEVVCANCHRIRTINRIAAEGQAS